MKSFFLILVLLVAPAFAQRECSNNGFIAVPTMNFVDSNGIVHETSCWDPNAKQLTFRLPGNGLLNVVPLYPTAGSGSTFVGIANANPPSGGTIILSTNYFNPNNNTVAGYIQIQPGGNLKLATDITAGGSSITLDNFGTAQISQTIGIGNVSGSFIWNVNSKQMSYDDAGGLIVSQNVVKSLAFVAYGNKFTASGCGNSTTLGGGTAGSYHSGTTGTCTVTITMGSGTPAVANGWSCRANDLTTPADVQTQTATTTTTATISGTTVSGDVVNFSCIGY